MSVHPTQGTSERPEKAFYIPLAQRTIEFIRVAYRGVGVICMGDSWDGCITEQPTPARTILEKPPAQFADSWTGQRMSLAQQMFLSI